MKVYKGSCLCGVITFEVQGPLHPPDACPCAICRKQSGHFWASTDVPKEALQILTGQDNLRWYQSSEKVRRGFCGECGSVLFWDPLFYHTTAIAMGAFDESTQLQLAKHIFVSEKGDYYELADDLPKFQRY